MTSKARSLEMTSKWSLRSEIISEFCLSVLTTATASTFLEYDQMDNSLLRYFLLQSNIKIETYHLMQKRFRRSLESYIVEVQALIPS